MSYHKRRKKVTDESLKIETKLLRESYQKNKRRIKRMGQRSQIFIRHENKLVVANYYQWNYGERMISRARGIMEWIKEYSEFSFIWESKYHMTHLSRICDTNFDMRDVAISCDIIKEWQEDFQQEPFNDFVFKYQDNRRTVVYRC